MDLHLFCRHRIHIVDNRRNGLQIREDGGSLFICYLGIWNHRKTLCWLATTLAESYCFDKLLVYSIPFGKA